MKPVEKGVLAAGLSTYHTAMVSKATMILQDIRRQMHASRTGKPQVWGVLTDWEGFYGLARAQIMVLRRAKLTFEYVTNWQSFVDDVLAGQTRIYVAGRDLNTLVRDDMSIEQALEQEREEDTAEEERTRDLARIEASLREAGAKQWDPENDPRWNDVNDDTPVRWVNEGAPKTILWGALDHNARKTVDMQPDGTLVGGFPF